MLNAPGAGFGWEPEGRSAVTTVLLDPDYLVGLFCWQHLEHVADLAVAVDLAARMYPDPIQMLRMASGTAARRWRLVDLAEHACSSKSQYVCAFHYAYGMSPFDDLKLLRMREMARLLRETDMPVLTVYQRVGGGARSLTAVAFRHYYALRRGKSR